MELIDYFRILKAFTIFLFTSNVQNQNGKVLKEILAGSHSDSVKTTLRGLHNFQNGLPPFAILEKLLAINLSLSESITNGSVGWCITSKLIGYQFKLPAGILEDLVTQTDMKVHVTYSLRRWKFSFANGSKLALSHPNDPLCVIGIAYDIFWLKSHSVNTEFDFTVKIFHV